MVNECGVIDCSSCAHVADCLGSYRFHCLYRPGLLSSALIPFFDEHLSLMQTINPAYVVVHAGVCDLNVRDTDLVNGNPQTVAKNLREATGYLDEQLLARLPSFKLAVS